MRWLILKEAMKIARDALGTDDVWVDLPPRLSPSGEINVYKASDPSGPVAQISCSFSPGKGGGEARLALGDQTSSVRLPKRKPLSIRTSAKKMKDGEAALLRHGNFAAALLKKVVAGMPRRELEAFCSAQGLPPSMAKKLEGTPYQVKVARRNKYRRGDRVRVVAPDMEYGELGYVAGKPRKSREGKYWYPVIVDGSSELREYPGEWLRPNMAGRVGE